MEKINQDAVSPVYISSEYVGKIAPYYVVVDVDGENMPVIACESMEELIRFSRLCVKGER